MELSASSETEETPTSGLRPPVSLSSMTALTTSANTPGRSSSRTDETSSTVVEGSTVFNVDSSMGDKSIVEIYSTQFTMTIPPDVSTVTLSSDAVSISHSIDIPPESEINILATNTEGNTGSVEPPIMPTPSGESPMEYATGYEALTTTMKTTITTRRASAAVIPSEAPTLSDGLPSTTLETPATSIIATAPTGGLVTTTGVLVTTVLTTRTAEAMVTTSTEASITPTEATMSTAETTSMTAKAVNLIQATNLTETPVKADAATATLEITTSTTAAGTTMADITTTVEAVTTNENATVIPLPPSWSTCPGGLTGPNCGTWLS